MKLLPTILPLATGLIAGALALPAAVSAAAAPTFYADSGDACPYGATKGTLSWQAISPTAYSSVQVTGSVVDQPVQPPTSTACANDAYYSTAYFTLYVGSTAVDKAAEQVNNAEATFDFTLKPGASSGQFGAESLVVQVCRSPVPPIVGPPTYCGKPATYSPMSAS